MPTDEHGFAPLEIILAIIIVCIIGFAGWFSWHREHTTSHHGGSTSNSQASRSPSQTSTNKNTKATSNPTDQSASYLVIPEWGVRIKLSGAISGAYYEVSGYDSTGKVADQIDLSLESLADTQCKAGGWPPEVYFRYTDTDTDPVTGKLYTTLDGTDHKVGSYYYASEDGQGVSSDGSCQSTTANQAKANAAASAFKAALDTLQASP